MFWGIPRNVWRYSPEYLRTFPGMFGDISRNIWGHSPECIVTFPGMFGDIPRNISSHPPIFRVPSIPFPVPVFLVLYIAWFHDVFSKIVYQFTMSDFYQLYQTNSTCLLNFKSCHSFWVEYEESKPCHVRRMKFRMYRLRILCKHL